MNEKLTRSVILRSKTEGSKSRRFFALRAQNDDRVRGFTLVEVLIVVVIIGIMAGLVLPRLTGQPEKFHLGEAMHLLGAIRRAQLGYSDQSGGTHLSLNNADSPGSAGYDNFSKLGLQVPQPSGKLKYFSCADTDDICTASTTTATPSSTDGTIQVNLVDGTFTCTGIYDSGGGTCLVDTVPTASYK